MTTMKTLTPKYDTMALTEICLENSSFHLENEKEKKTIIVGSGSKGKKSHTKAKKIVLQTVFTSNIWISSGEC